MADLRKLVFIKDNRWRFTHINKKGVEVPFVMDWDDLPKEINEQEVEVLETLGNNSPIKFRFNDKIYERNKIVQNQPVLEHRQNRGNINEMPHPQTPYNFIPLNEKVVSSNALENNFSIYEGNSGYIEVDIVNHTPLYIKGEGVDHFKINDKYAIPGSSLRGMLRNLVEIVSWSKFQFFDNKYISDRLDANEYCNYAMKRRYLGFLTKGDKSFFIEPLKGKPEPIKDFSEEYLYQIFGSGEKMKIYTKFVGGKNNSLTKYFEIPYKGQGPHSKLEISKQAIKNYKDDDKRGSKSEMQDILVSCINRNIIKRIEDKKVKYIGIPVWFEAETIEGRQVVISFGHCRNYRVPFKNSIADAVQNKQKDYNNDNLIDFAESLFGIVEKDRQRAGKVFVEDAITETCETNKVILQILSTPYPKNAKIYLSGNTKWKERPIIKGYKNYWHRDTTMFNDETNFNQIHNIEIEQINYQKTRFRRDEEYRKINLRDNHPFKVAEVIKQVGNAPPTYHVFTKKIEDGVLDNPTIVNLSKIISNDDKLQFKFVNTIQPTATFKGRIRFDNLTNEELGALLFVLNLPEGCMHKIGTGKPIGMGSIKITSTLKLINRKNRYQSLFEADHSWNECIENREMGEFIEAFSSYMQKEIPCTDLWQHERLQTLKAMMKYTKADNEKWLKMTNYMTLEGFRQTKSQSLETPLIIDNFRNRIS